MMRLFIIALVVLLPAALPAATEYDREDWAHWEDFDQDCQNTRHELLISLSLVEVKFTSDSGCYVSTGV